MILTDIMKAICYCVAKKADGHQCTRRQKDGTRYCGKHLKLVIHYNSYHGVDSVGLKGFPITGAAAKRLTLGGGFNADGTIILSSSQV